MFRVLIVEDDQLLRQQLTRLLNRTYIVTTASSVSQVDAQLERKNVDLILLDRLLPDGDAIELLPYLRECSPSTRILVLSNRSAIEERIVGLREGADDYVAKPFSADEIVLRIKRLLQFERVPSDNWLEIGRLRFNRLTGETLSGTHKVHLRPREAQILSCLLHFKNRVVTRETIVNHVWGSSTLPTNTTLDVYLRRLRMMLGETAAYIKTVRGFGYLIRDPEGAYK